MSTDIQVVRKPEGLALQRVAQWALPIMLVTVVVIAAVTTDGFMTFDNLRAILINTSVVGIVAVGMTAVTVSGNMFSLGSQYSTMLATVIFLAVVGETRSILIAGVVAVLVLCLVGALQGMVVAAGLNPIITTLAVGAIIYGIVTWLTNGETITPQGAEISWIAVTNFLGLPLPVYVFVIYTLLTTWWIERTTAGRRIVLMGANRATASISGINTRRTTIWAFLSMSVGMAIAGIISAAQLGQAQSNDLPNLTMDVIAAVLVGGAAIQGGEGSPIRSAAGALFIVILSNVMLLHGLPTGARMAGVGLLVTVVVVTLHILRKKAGSR